MAKLWLPAEHLNCESTQSNDTWATLPEPSPHDNENGHSYGHTRLIRLSSPITSSYAHHFASPLLDDLNRYGFFFRRAMPSIPSAASSRGQSRAGLVPCRAALGPQEGQVCFHPRRGQFTARSGRCMLLPGLLFLLETMSSSESGACHTPAPFTRQRLEASSSCGSSVCVVG
jgi:hypothetical protein